MKNDVEVNEKPFAPAQDDWVSKTPETSRRPSIAITYPYPLGEASGGSRMTREIARHLAQSGADVVLLPVSTNGLRRSFPRSAVSHKLLGHEFDEPLSRDGVEIHRISQNPVHFELDGLSVKKALKRILKRRKVDIVLSYYHEAFFLPSFLRSQNVKFGFIATWISYERMARTRPRHAREFLRYLKNQRLVARPYQCADIVFATSHHTRSQLVDMVGIDEGRIAVCYLGVDPSFGEIPRRPPQEVTRFLFVGRVVPAKGFEDALQALGQLAARGFNNWTFRIVGEGRHDRARNLARKCGIADKVVVCGAVDDKGLRRELEQAHLAIMPSHREAFGLAFAEAQAAGLPVVAYEAGSVPEVVENGVTGWLASFRKVEQLAHCIETAILDPQGTFQAGLAGRERVARLFTWKKTAATILDGIQTLT